MSHSLHRASTSVGTQTPTPDVNTYHPEKPIMYFQKVQREANEININLVEYFKGNYELLNGFSHPTQSLRAYLLQSMCSPTEFMVVPDGSPVLGHLPLIEDLVGCYSEGACILLYWMLQGFYSSSTGLIIPSDLAEVIDMKPILNIENTPIYSFPMNWRHIFVGSYTDTVHVMRFDISYTQPRVQVEGSTVKPKSQQHLPIRKRYHRISYRGEHISSNVSSELDLGSVVLLWNARGCTRPSFVQHFTTLFDKFNPVLFVILEARIFSESTTYLMYYLPGSYEVCHCGPQRRPGGVLVLWKPSALMGNFLYTSNAPTGMVFDAVFKARPPPGYSSLRYQPPVEFNNDPCSSDEEDEPGSYLFNSGLAFDGSCHHLGIGKDLC